MSLEQIAQEVCEDQTPGIDGFTNAERVSLVREIFGFSSFSISSNFDWELAIVNGDPMILIGTYHLAQLQRDFFMTALEYGASVADAIRVRMRVIEQVCQRIVWMLASDEDGEYDNRYIFRR